MSLTTLNQTRGLLIAAGIDVSMSDCADLTTPVTEGAGACTDGEFKGVDIHQIPYASTGDALSVNNYDYKSMLSFQYTTKICP